MNTYKDVYEPINRTRFVLLILLLCVTVFYYSTQTFVVEASYENGCTSTDHEECVAYLS